MPASGNNETGLLRELTWVHSVSVIVGTMIGAGIFVVTGSAAKSMGPAVPLGFLLGIPIIVTTALVYSVFMSSPLGEHPGGAYVHISRTWNSLFVGYIFMWLKWVSFIGALDVLALGFGQAMGYFSAFDFLGATGWAIVWLSIFFVLNIVGVDIFGNAQAIMTGLLVLILLVLAIPGIFFIDPGQFSPMFPTEIYSNGFFQPFLAGMSALMFSYIGFESLAQTAGETENPTRTLPRVFGWSTLAVGVLYTLVTLVVIGVIGWQSAAGSSTPLTAAAENYFPVGTAGIVAFGSMLAFATSVNSTFMVPPRILFAFGEDNLIPNVLTHVNERFHTPDVGLVITYVLAVVLVLTSTFSFALSIALAALFLLYTAHSLSALALPWVRPQLWEACEFRLKREVLVVITLVSAATMGLFAWQTLSVNSLGPALGKLAQGQVLDAITSSTILLILVWALVGVAIYGGYRWYLSSQGVEFDAQAQLEDMYEAPAGQSSDD